MKKILLLDDDDAARRILSDRLRAMGLAVISASDSMEALAILDLTGAGIDIMLTGIVLRPGMPHDIALANMARVRYPGMRVIFMAESDDGLDMLSSQGEVFYKPLDMDLLAAEIFRPLDTH